MIRFLPRFLWTFLALGVLVVVGTAGYVLINLSASTKTGSLRELTGHA